MLGGGVRIEDWTRSVCAWQMWRESAWLEAPPRLRAEVARRVRDGVGSERDREIVMRRYGLGPRPETLREIAAFLGLPVVKAAGVVRGVEREVG